MVCGRISSCIGVPGFSFVSRLKNKRKSCFQEYVTYIQQNWPVVALIFIVILGAVLRFNHYSVIPPHGDTMDVYQEAWNGYHILHGDGPQSWEGAYFVSAYKGGDKSSLQWFGDSFTIVKRYIAHPPLFSILRVFHQRFVVQRCIWTAD